MPESSQTKDSHRSAAECKTPPLRLLTQPSMPLHRNLHTISTFCTEQNVQECLSHITQEVSLLGLPLELSDSGVSELSIVAVLNCAYNLIQLHHRSMRTLESMEMERLKLSSNVDFLQLSTTHLKEQLDVSKRENTGLLERERQLQLKVKSMQNALKNEKEEVQKLQSIISSRACQYSHDMKRKEREFNKLKERLNQLLTDKKERKQAIDVLNSVGRVDGKRSLWRTQKTESKHEGEVYKTILSDYDSRQRELVLENAELKMVLQQMKKEIMSMLRSKKPTLHGERPEFGGKQIASEEEEDEVFDSSKESVELYCDNAREKLTNSIRLQWRRLKSHVERLDSQVSITSLCESKNSDAVPRETHEEETQRLKMEIQQCKDFIQTQQRLLQQQLSSPSDEGIASPMDDGYMQQEKEFLGGERNSLEEQRRILQKERRNFTDATITLSHERKIFEEDQATWLKQQFLSLSVMESSNYLQLSKSTSAFLSSAGSDVREVADPENLSKSPWYSPKPRSAPVMSGSKVDPFCPSKRTDQRD